MIAATEPESWTHVVQLGMILTFFGWLVYIGR